MRGCRLEDSCGTLTRILLVENEPVIIAVCQRVLTREGFEVDIALNGKTAQSMILLHDYALCLIDVRTRILDGRELYKWLKERHPRLAGRVIFTTGDLMGDETHRFLEQSDRPFLFKPYRPDELVNIVTAEIEHQNNAGRKPGSGETSELVVLECAKAHYNRYANAGSKSTTFENLYPELDAIATGVEAKLDPFSSYARLVTQRTIETAREIDIAEEKIIAWTRARVKLEVERRKVIKTFLPRLVTIPPPSVKSAGKRRTRTI